MDLRSNLQSYTCLSSFPSQDCSGNTALHLAVQARKADCVSALIDAGADPTVPNEDDFSPIAEAAKSAFFTYVHSYAEVHVKVKCNCMYVL